MMIGWNANEGDPFAPRTMSLDAFSEYARRQYGADREAFLRLYPAKTDDEARAAYAAYVRDLGFAFPLRIWARVQRKTGKSSAFVFFFERGAPDEPLRGAHHGVELTYAFHNIGVSGRPFEDVDRRISDALSSYLVRFATTGDPNDTGLPNWPAYEEQRDAVLVLGDRIEVRVVPQKAALDLFESSFASSALARPRN